VAFGEHGDTRQPSVGAQTMHMRVEQCRTCRLYATLDRRLDVMEIVETASAEEVDDEVLSRELRPVCFNEVILSDLPVHALGANKVFLLGGA
jgi:hypothetical protein